MIQKVSGNVWVSDFQQGKKQITQSHWSSRFKECFCYHLKLPFYPCLSTTKSTKYTVIHTNYWYFKSPLHHTKDTRICFDRFSHESSGSLCRWFSSFSFLVSACGSVRHRSVVIKSWSWKSPPPIDGESIILSILPGTPSLIIGAYHVHTLFMQVPIPSNTYISCISIKMHSSTAWKFPVCIGSPNQSKFIGRITFSEYIWFWNQLSGRWIKREFIVLHQVPQDIP